MSPINLDNIPPSKAFTYLVLGLVLIIPGLSYIFLRKNELFLDLNFGKLIILSVFYSFPLFIEGLFYVIIGKFIPARNKDEFYRKLINNISVFVMTCFFLTGIIFYFFKPTIFKSNIIIYSYTLGGGLVIVVLIKSLIEPLWKRLLTCLKNNS